MSKDADIKAEIRAALASYKTGYSRKNIKWEASVSGWTAG
jgi:hypothetical protein